MWTAGPLIDDHPHEFMPLTHEHDAGGAIQGLQVDLPTPARRRSRRFDGQHAVKTNILTQLQLVRNGQFVDRSQFGVAHDGSLEWVCNAAIVGSQKFLSFLLMVHLSFV